MTARNRNLAMTARNQAFAMTANSNDFAMTARTTRAKVHAMAASRRNLADSGPMDAAR
jgi:hypothetical protein